MSKKAILIVANFPIWYNRLMWRILYFWVVMVLAACTQFPDTTTHLIDVLTETSSTAEVTRSVPVAVEQPVTLLPLSGPLAASTAEISGLAWYGETLVFLPQYPGRFADSAHPGYLFSLPKSAILSYLDGTVASLPSPQPVPFDPQGVERAVPGFEGFEAIVFVDNRVFLTIEARQGATMSAHLVSGEVDGELAAIWLDPSSLVQIPAQATPSNMSDEALVFFGDTLITFYEANGVHINPEPIAHRFSSTGEPAGPQAFPNLEYRLTDASQPDGSGRFWVINYFFPGDLKLDPAPDPIFTIYGEGASHAVSNVVERLVALQIGPDEIYLADIPPIQLELLKDGEARNWEGLAQLDELGFLLATDKFPETLFAFVPLPK